MEGYVPGTPFVPEKTFEKVSTYGNQLNTAYQNALNARERVLKQERALEANRKKTRKDMAPAGIKQAGPQKFFREQYFDKIQEGWGTLQDDEMNDLLETAWSVYKVLIDAFPDDIEEQRDQLEKLSLSTPNYRKRVGGSDQRFSNQFGKTHFNELNKNYQEGFKYGDDGFNNGLVFVEKDPISGLPIVENEKGEKFVWGNDQVDYFDNKSYFDYNNFLEEYSEKSMTKYGEDDVSNKQFEASWSRSVAEKLFNNNFKYGSSAPEREFRVAMASVEKNADIKKKLEETTVEIFLGEDKIAVTALELFYEGMIDDIPDSLKSVVDEETGETVKGELDLLIENAKEEYIEGTKFSADASGRTRPTADEKKRSRIFESGFSASSGEFRFAPEDKRTEFDPQKNEAEIFRYDLNANIETDIMDTNIAGTEAVVQNIVFRNIAFTEDYDGDGVGLVVTLTNRSQQIGTDSNIDVDEWTKAKDAAIDRGDDIFTYDGKQYRVDSELTKDGGNISISVKSSDQYFFPGDSKNFSNIMSAVTGEYGSNFFSRLMNNAKAQLNIE